MAPRVKITYTVKNGLASQNEMKDNKYMGNYYKHVQYSNHFIYITKLNYSFILHLF